MALAHPEIIFERLGIPWEGEAAHAGEVHAFVLGLYECWTDEERLAYLVDIFDRLAEAAPYLGSELVALLPASEAACVEEQLGGDRYQAFLASNLTRGFGDEVRDCFSDESYTRMFLATTQARVGAFSDETVACLSDLAREHVHFVEISTTLDAETLTPAEFAEISNDGLLMLECMNEDELVRLQGIGAQNLLAEE